MIPIIAINQIAKRYQVPIDTIEKDYMISWLLLCLANSPLNQDFTFYGGTAIKRIFFEDHRFSEDIDLVTDKKFQLDYILEQLKCLTYAKYNANIDFSINTQNINTQHDRIQLFVDYQGFDEIVGAAKQIKIDFSMDREAFGITEAKPIIPTYPDIADANQSITTLNLNAILANKLGMLMDSTRNEPRDIYDIWFLLDRTDQFDFDAKLVSQFYKQKYGYYPSVNTLLSQLERSVFSRNWQTRLSHQLSKLPPYQTIQQAITKQFQLLS